jgi:hypothetical protein
VRLGPSTPGDYVRARVLVPPKPGCDTRPRPRVSVFNRLNFPALGSWPSSSKGRIGSPRLLGSNSSGVVLGGGIPNRSKFQISNSSWSRPRNLQLHPVRACGPVGLPGPPTLSCHFCKGRGHLDFFLSQQEFFLRFSSDFVHCLWESGHLGGKPKFS